AAGHLRKIVARAEYFARRRQNHCAHLSIAASVVQGPDELLHQFERKRITALRTVEGEDGNRSFDRRRDVFEAHVITPVRVRGRAARSSVPYPSRCAAKLRTLPTPGT